MHGTGRSDHNFNCHIKICILKYVILKYAYFNCHIKICIQKYKIQMHAYESKKRKGKKESEMK